MNTKKSGKAAVLPSSTSDKILDKLIDEISPPLNGVKRKLKRKAVHCCPYDHRRLNGVGKKKQGFIESVFKYAVKNPQFFNAIVSIKKFRQNIKNSVKSRALYETSKQIQEYLLEMTTQNSNMAYSDALHFYSLIRIAAKYRVNGAQEIYRDLKQFFNKQRTAGEVITEKKLKREMQSCAFSNQGGEMLVKNLITRIREDTDERTYETITGIDQYIESEEDEE
jgi:hypothetical protein